MPFRFHIAVVCLALGAAPHADAAQDAPPPLSPETEFNPHIQSWLNAYCHDCHGNGKHKGDVRLDRWSTAEDAAADPVTWQKILRVVQAHEMPPPDKPQPPNRDRDVLADWINTRVFRCDGSARDPGRVTLRRLNRAEYDRTLRDLLGIEFEPAADFPVDASGHGFDTVGDALSLPPVLMEKYLRAAERAVEAAFGPEQGAVQSERRRYPVDLLEVGYNAKQQGDGWVALNSIEEDDVAIRRETAVHGDFILRVRAAAHPRSERPMELTFMADRTVIEVRQVPEGEPAVYEARFRAAPGSIRFRAVVRRVKDGLSPERAAVWKSGEQQKGDLWVEWFEVEGPLNASAPERPAPYRRLVFLEPKHPRDADAASSVVERFARRAFRRPVREEELARLMGLVRSDWERGGTFDSGLRLAMQAVLISPQFLFRHEAQPLPNDPAAAHDLDEFALASRLSYFLWSTMPDEELFALAEAGALRRNLEPQIARMLRDEKARALVENFAGQWLELRNLDERSPDPVRFKDFSSKLRDSMREETERLFAHIMSEDRSVLDFLLADYTFVDEPLAKLYGLPGVSGSEFRKVSLAGTPRRGLLTHASILTLTSNPTRTSPVKRGKWVLENLLNTPPPPPAPDVPPLADDQPGRDLTGTLRQRLELHRADPACASCHARMDPIGFALERFDPIGAWRDEDGGAAIDDTGRLVTGETFQGARELAALLGESKSDRFIRCLAEKLLTFALGRGLEYYDKCSVDDIVARVRADGGRFSTLIVSLAQSAPFQRRRGESSAADH